MQAKTANQPIHLDWQLYILYIYVKIQINQLTFADELF